MIPPLHIHLLGDFLLVSGETPVTTVTVPRVQSLFAYLVLHRNAPQDRSHLAFLLWPDSTEAQAHTNLRQLLYHLRQSLPDADQFLYADKQSLQWRPIHGNGAFTLDVQEMEQALAQAEQAKHCQDRTSMQQALKQVLHLYRGDLLPGCYDEWILPERDRLRQMFLQTAERLSALLEEERAYSDAITVAQQLLHQEPLHEATYRQLMRLYALRGDRAAALRVYHSCAKFLERELGTEPSEATRAVYEVLMQSSSSLETQANPLTPRGREAPLLGRNTEWRHLQEAWRKVVGGHTHIVILTGEAGIGKTRLAEEMEAWVSRQGMTTTNARCYATLGHLAYAPITTWLCSDALNARLSALDPIFLTEIARLVPEVLTTHPDLPCPAPMTERWQRQHFFEALARAVLSARQPLLLLLDDLQWCDHETLEWLQYLCHFDSKARLLLLGTVRAEEISPSDPLVTLLGAWQRNHLLTELALGPLTPTETTTLAEHIVGRQLASAVMHSLYTETEGNPLFVVEMVRAGTFAQDKTEPRVLDQPLPLLARSASTLPPMLQAVLETRLAQLSPLAHEVANAAAVIGREFPFSVLAQASGLQEEAVVRGLDELWQRRIVREQDTGTAENYDFSHDKLREQVYAALSPASRRLLHRRVAEAIQAVSREDLDAVSGQVAAHYDRACLPNQAIPFYQRAGEVARRLYANAAALHTFERAAALLEAHIPQYAQQDVPWASAAQIYESMGDVSAEVGSYQKASQAYQHALKHVPLQAPLWQARLHRKVARSWRYVSTHPGDAAHITARQAFEKAECLLSNASDPSSPAWRHEWIELQFAHIWQTWPLRGSMEDMMTAVEKVRPMVEQHGTEEQRDLLSYALAVHDLILDRYVKSLSDEQRAARRAALTALEQTGDQSRIGTGHFGFGVALLWSGHLDEAEEHLATALCTGERISSAVLQMRCLTFLPFIYRWRGQVEQVRRIFMQAQAIGAVQNNNMLLGHRAWVAWRDGNLVEAENYGRTSLEDESSQLCVNPLQWVGRWPLIGVALMQERVADAMTHVDILLTPMQQPPPDHLNALLEAARHAWDAGKPEEARILLHQAASLAEQMGYL